MIKISDYKTWKKIEVLEDMINKVKTWNSRQDKIKYHIILKKYIKNMFWCLDKTKLVYISHIYHVIDWYKKTPYENYTEKL